MSTSALQKPPALACYVIVWEVKCLCQGWQSKKTSYILPYFGEDTTEAAWTLHEGDLCNPASTTTTTHTHYSRIISITIIYLYHNIIAQQLQKSRAACLSVIHWVVENLVGFWLKLPRTHQPVILCSPMHVKRFDILKRIMPRKQPQGSVNSSRHISQKQHWVTLNSGVTKVVFGVDNSSGFTLHYTCFWSLCSVL